MQTVDDEEDEDVFEVDVEEFEVLNSVNMCTD